MADDCLSACEQTFADDDVYLLLHAWNIDDAIVGIVDKVHGADVKSVIFFQHIAV